MHQHYVHGREIQAFLEILLDFLIFLIQNRCRIDPVVMNKSWDELAAALDAILPSENHGENTPSTIAHVLPLESPEQETIVDENDLKNSVFTGLPCK